MAMCCASPPVTALLSGRLRGVLTKLRCLTEIFAFYLVPLPCSQVGCLPSVASTEPTVKTSFCYLVPLPRSVPVVLLRADVGRLPFATGSVAAIHAGAAIHCWPNPQARLNL